MNKHFDVVVYHNPCSDGMGSLWSVVKSIPDIVHVPCKAGEVYKLDMDIFTGDILFVDICPDYNTLEKISKQVSWITILDHHESVFKLYKENYNKENVIISDQIYAINNNIEFILDNDRSGCQIAWDYFNPSIARNSNRPWFLNYIADRDLWTWKLKDSKEINQGMYDMNYLTLEGMTIMENMSKDEIQSMMIKGRKSLQLFNIEVNNICNTAIQSTFTINKRTYNAWLVTCTYVHKSEVGNTLSKTSFPNNLEPDFTAIYSYDPKSSDIWISLRGIDKVDLNDLSKQYDIHGGGHKNAAGFTITNKKIHDVFIPIDIPVDVN